MSSIGTYSKTFTETHAAHIASKIAADLYQMQRFYGSPNNELIDKYVKEATILLKEGYLQSIDYGFRKNGIWVIACSYEVHIINGALTDNNAGKIPFGIDTTGATWGSYLRKNEAYDKLTIDEKKELANRLPFNRPDGADPQTGITGIVDKSYGAGNRQADRKIFKA